MWPYFGSQLVSIRTHNTFELTVRIWVGRVFVGGLMSSISVGALANMELWWEGTEWRVDENVEWFGLRDSCEKIHEWSWLFWWSESVVYVILLFATMLLRPHYCMSCVFAVYSVNDVQVKWVINKNPREVVLIVLIIPIVELVALIIPLVYPITIVTFITMVIVTIQLNTISTVTTVTLLILQLWHFFYSSEWADAETAPTIPN